jgi:hypothetical protein
VEHGPLQGIKSGSLSRHDHPLVDKEEGRNRLIEPAQGALKK